VSITHISMLDGEGLKAIDIDIVQEQEYNHCHSKIADAAIFGLNIIENKKKIVE